MARHCCFRPARATLGAFLLLAGLMGGLLAACGGGSSERPGPPPTPVSPNGEPLVAGGPSVACDAALGQWFDATDTNHDGSLDPDEFKADTKRWFDAMDLNHDGSVTPDELMTLRLKLMPFQPPPSEKRERSKSDVTTWFSDRPKRNSVNDRPDPVMSADVNLDNRVTWEEFEAQAARTFGQLDVNHDGRLSKAEVVASCPRH